MQYGLITRTETLLIVLLTAAFFTILKDDVSSSFVDGANLYSAHIAPQKKIYPYNNKLSTLL
jgi:hypothetical protein